jgi:hypothetical protein
MDDGMLTRCGCTHNDTEGVINLPLTAREIQAVVFFKDGPTGDVRVSMRSKYDVDVRSVASTTAAAATRTRRLPPSPAACPTSGRRSSSASSEPFGRPQESPIASSNAEAV